MMRPASLLLWTRKQSFSQNGDLAMNMTKAEPEQFIIKTSRGEYLFKLGDIHHLARCGRENMYRLTFLPSLAQRFDRETAERLSRGPGREMIQVYA